jgi:hypothetical protein
LKALGHVLGQGIAVDGRSGCGLGAKVMSNSPWWPTGIWKVTGVAVPEDSELSGAVVEDASTGTHSRCCGTCAEWRRFTSAPNARLGTGNSR